MTALENPVVVPSSKPRDYGKDADIDNEYDSYYNGQKGGSKEAIHIMKTR
jgi:hypothetical protein